MSRIATKGGALCIIERSEDDLAHTVRGLKLKRTGSGHGVPCF